MAKGWGFITPDDGSQDVFCHQVSLIHSQFHSIIVELLATSSPGKRKESPGKRKENKEGIYFHRHIVYLYDT